MKHIAIEVKHSNSQGAGPIYIPTCDETITHFVERVIAAENQAGREVLTWYSMKLQLVEMSGSLMKYGDD